MNTIYIPSQNQSMKRQMNNELLLVIVVGVFAPFCSPLLGQNNYVQTKVYLGAGSSNPMTAISYYDAWGRPRQTISEGFSPSNGTLANLTEYDSSGRTHKTWASVRASGLSYQPDFSSLSFASFGDTLGYSITEYDGLNRPVSTSVPGLSYAGHLNTIEYSTNTEGDSVKHYMASLYNNELTLRSYYLANRLQKETYIDPDGRMSITFTNKLGQKILERRIITASEHTDTYFVYDQKQQLRFVLTPNYQSTPDLNQSAYRYEYDGQGRCVSKTMPGCNPVTYTYDKHHRICCMQDGVLSAQNKFRFFLYDGLGRLCVQGISDAIYEADETNMDRLSYSNAAGFMNTGYDYPGLTELLNPSACSLEMVNYYDSYAFLEGSSALAPYIISLSSVSNLHTGSVQSASNGETLHTAYCYDEYGRVIRSVEMGLKRQITVKDIEYNFCNGVTREATSYLAQDGNGTYHETYQSIVENKYEIPHTKLLTSSLLYITDMVNGVSKSDTTTFTYNDFGHVVGSVRGEASVGMSYEYDNLRGWLTDISSSQGFEQHLYRENGGDRHYYNGSIAAMSWSVPGEATKRRYDYEYDGQNRLTQATYSDSIFESGQSPNAGSPLPGGASSRLLSLIPQTDYTGNRYNEVIGYDRNSNVSSLQRYGMLNDRTYGVIDDLTVEYIGNQRDRVTDDADTQLLYIGASDFVDKQNAGTEYDYNVNGALIKDLNRGITNIEYDLLGNPKTITLTGSCSIDYVYSADGRHLRTVRSHMRPLSFSSLQVSGMNQSTHNMSSATGIGVGFVPGGPLRPAMDKDSTDYLNNFLFHNGHPHQYHFDGGYVDFTADAMNDFHYYIKDYLGNNRMVVNGHTDSIEQVTHYYPYGGVIGDISTNESLQKYKFEGMELDRTFGLDNYDIHARQYFAMAPMWDRVDPLAEKYYGISPYAYCGGDPVNCLDLTGKYSIWCNGQTTEENRGQKSYWGDLPQIVNDTYGKENVDFRDGSIGGWENTFSISHSRYNLKCTDRIKAGTEDGFSSASIIINQLKRNEYGEVVEPITIFAHSMGCAYAKGFASGLIDWMRANSEVCEGVRITEYDFSAFQPASQSAVEGVETYQYAHAADMVCPFGAGNNDRIQGVSWDHYTLSVDGDHKIETYITVFQNLPSGSTFVFRNGQFVQE